MNTKPDFGPSNRRIDWTPARVRYIRDLAARSMSAADIAKDIGLTADHGPRIAAVCARFDIPLKGQAGRRRTGDARVYRVAVTSPHDDLLSSIARRHGLHVGTVAERLVNAACEQGLSFCENMLDLGDVQS